MKKTNAFFQLLLILALATPTFCMHKPYPQQNKTDDTQRLEKLANLFAQQLQECHDLYDQCYQDIYGKQPENPKQNEKNHTKKNPHKSFITTLVQWFKIKLKLNT